MVRDTDGRLRGFTLLQHPCHTAEQAGADNGGQNQHPLLSGPRMQAEGPAHDDRTGIYTFIHPVDTHSAEFFAVFQHPKIAHGTAVGG